MSSIGFLAVPEPTAEAQALFDEDLADPGFVMNMSRLWAYQPSAVTALFGLIDSVASRHRLGFRERGILVSATASTLGDSYCSLAWGSRLAQATDPETASGVLRGDDGGLTPSERVLAGWARKVARDPNGTSAADVQALRDAGYDDARVFGITVYVALRLALATVDDALGVGPDREYRLKAPQAVLDAVDYGRRIHGEPAVVGSTDDAADPAPLRDLGSG